MREKGMPSSFFVCGDATKNIEPMCLTRPDCIAIDENVDIVEAKKLTDAHGITISGNLSSPSPCCSARSRTTKRPPSN